FFLKIGFEGVEDFLAVNDAGRDAFFFQKAGPAVGSVISCQENEDVFLADMFVEVIEQFGNVPVEAKIGVFRLHGIRPETVSYVIGSGKTNRKKICNIV